LKPLDADGNEIGMWGEPGANAESSEEESSSEEEEESSEDDAAPTQAQQDMSREERRAAAKAKKDAAIAKKKAASRQVGDLPSSSEEESEEDDMPANPNHSKAARSQAARPPAAVEEAAEGVAKMNVGASKQKPVAELSRREREALQAQQARERYQKLHEQGKTDEAKADLARLRVIRERRAAEAARKQVSCHAQDRISTLPYKYANDLLYRLRRKSARRLRRTSAQRLMPKRPRSVRQLWVQPRRARSARNKAGPDCSGVEPLGRTMQIC
jgi:hypothetical protein